jgi:hypothetical protein
MANDHRSCPQPSSSRSSLPTPTAVPSPRRRRTRVAATGAPPRGGGNGAASRVPAAPVLRNSLGQVLRLAALCARDQQLTGGAGSHTATEPGGPRTRLRAAITLRPSTATPHGNPVPIKTRAARADGSPVVRPSGLWWPPTPPTPSTPQDRTLTSPSARAALPSVQARAAAAETVLLEQSRSPRRLRPRPDSAPTQAGSRDRTNLGSGPPMNCAAPLVTDYCLRSTEGNRGRSRPGQTDAKHHRHGPVPTSPGPGFQFTPVAARSDPH